MMLSQTDSLEETLKGPELFREHVLSEDFKAGLKRLYQLPLHLALYEVTSCLWEMWKSDPPAADTFWLVSVNSRLELTGIAVISERTSRNWSNYYSIDDSIGWEQTLDFQITQADIVFGPHKRPSFYGLYQYLKKVGLHLLKSNQFKKLSRCRWQA